MEVGDIFFINYPVAVQYQEKASNNSSKGLKPINQLLWGDKARINTIAGDWINIRCRRRNGWVRKENLQPSAILEVNFVDVGQGDGCHVRTSEGENIVIDAGERDNMFRFLSWRYGKFIKKFRFESFIITHPDKDHYMGFMPLLEHLNIKVDDIYHNTIVEQITANKSSLGTETKVARKRYLTGLVQTFEQLKKITNSAVRRGKRRYANMLRIAVNSGRVKNISGLLASSDWQTARYVPGYSPQDNRGMTLKILGPVPQELTPGKSVLPRLGSNSITKNGHSIVILLEIGTIKIFLGGDLNSASQNYLLQHYTGLNPSPKTIADSETLIKEARKYFEADIAKACHHGSSDVSINFLQASNPLATIISSGDNEPYSHPRPDALGMIGKYSRSDRPFIFSTELARSGNDTIKHPYQIRRDLRKQIDFETAIINDVTSSKIEKKNASERLDQQLKIIERSIANYGMINVLTDGDRLLIVQRLERKRSKSIRWDYYKFETDDRGRLSYVN